MPGIFYDIEQAAEVLGVPAVEIEEMIELRELKLVQVVSRRLVHVRDVQKIADRVQRGGPLRVRREFHGAMIPEAVRLAANELDVPEKELVYEVLEHPQLRMPGVEGRPARIAVQLPDGVPNLPEEINAAPTTIAEVPVNSKEQTDIVQAVQLAADVSSAGEELRAVEAPSIEPPSAASENIGVFYAPEQVAQLLGRKTSEVNLWIYRRELPTVNINGYLWVPEEAATELLEKEPSIDTAQPPKPFWLVVPSEETATGQHVYRLSEGEVAEDDMRDALRRKVAQLEKLVEALRGEILRGAPDVPDRFFDTAPPRKNGYAEPDALRSA